MPQNYSVGQRNENNNVNIDVFYGIALPKLH